MPPSSTIQAIGARLERPGVAFTIIDSTTTPQAFEAQPATWQEDASTNSTPLQVSASSLSIGKSAVICESTTSSTPTRNSFDNQLFVAATTDLVRQASPASDETKQIGNDWTKQALPAKEFPVVATKSPWLAKNPASTSPPATPSPTTSKTLSRASPPASSRVGAKLPQTPPTSGTLSAKATPMSRSPAMGIPTPQGKRTKPLSGAQCQKLKKLAADVGANSTTAPAQLSVTSTACRVVTSPLQSTSGFGLARIGYEVEPTLLEANMIQDLVSTTPAVQSGAVATANSVAGRSWFQSNLYLNINTNTRIMDFLGTRKRKTTPPQTSQHANTAGKNLRPHRDQLWDTKTHAPAPRVNAKIAASITPQAIATVLLKFMLSFHQNTSLPAAPSGS
ncbi:hypothetical protein P7C70_g9251, partial [Phenoliferia sp. Uapishka_3]